MFFLIIKETRTLNAVLPVLILTAPTNRYPSMFSGTNGAITSPNRWYIIRICANLGICSSSTMGKCQTGM